MCTKTERKSMVEVAEMVAQSLDPSEYGKFCEVFTRLVAVRSIHNLDFLSEPEGVNSERAVKEQAQKICIKIFNKYSEEELSMVPKIMHKAWLIGKKATFDNQVGVASG